MVKIEQNGDRTCLYLLPNRSATWHQTKCAMSLVSATTLAVAAFWSLQGFWLILPFAGLEVGLLWYLGYKVCSATYHQQVVLLSKDNVEVQWGSRFPKRRWIFSRNDTELEVVRPRHSLSPHRLLLRDGHQAIAIADQLNQDDVKRTLDQLRASGFVPRFSGKTLTIAVEA